MVKDGAAFVAALILAVSVTDAAAGDWAAVSDRCKVWNPYPAGGETIRWTGACKDGFADGRGTLEWQRGGKTYERDGENGAAAVKWAAHKAGRAATMTASSPTACPTGGAF